MIVREIKELAREKTMVAVEALIAALTNPGERVQAATILLAYGYGRPQQTINVRKIRSMTDLDEEELRALANTGRPGEDRGTRH